MQRPAEATNAEVEGHLRRDDLRREEDGLVVVDGDGRVRLIDHRARELLGDLLAAGAPASPLLLDRPVMTLAPGAPEDPTLELRTTRARVDGRDGWAVTVADVSSRRAPLEEAHDLVSTVCHEMRTPLAGIVGYADALREAGEALPPDQRAAFVATILRQGERMARLVADLAVLARPGRGLDVRRADVRVADVVTEVLEAMRDEAGGITVTGERTLTVRVDRDHFASIVTNFITNARKYGAPPIVIELERQDFQGVLRVRDAGPGVPEGFVHRMWDRFSRARVDERPPEATGSGLGLAIVAGLTEVNNGHAWYERGQPTGACFCAGFPLANGPREAPTA